MSIINILLMIYIGIGILLADKVYSSYSKDKDIIIIAIISGFIWPIVIVALLFSKFK